MTLLFGAGCLAILLGLILLFTGETGHSKVQIRYLGGSIFGQAWLIILLLGFTLIALEVYLAS